MSIVKYKRQEGVPSFTSCEYDSRRNKYVVLIPVINEGRRIQHELFRALKAKVDRYADIVICDGGSTDGSMEEELLRKFRVNTLLVKTDVGRQGAQLRMGIWWALQRDYDGIITIDGNDKDSIEDVPRFIAKLKEGYGLIQGSRFIKGGHAVNTPLVRLVSVRFIHAPIISLTAHHWYTDTTNAYRAYSAEYLRDKRVQPLRDIFMGYELLSYLLVRATQLGYSVCEIPVNRVYPRNGKIPTKISLFKGNAELMKILLLNMMGRYQPRG